MKGIQQLDIYLGFATYKATHWMPVVVADLPIYWCQSLRLCVFYARRAAWASRWRLIPQSDRRAQQYPADLPDQVRATCMFCAVIQSKMHVRPMVIVVCQE